MTGVVVFRAATLSEGTLCGPVSRDRVVEECCVMKADLCAEERRVWVVGNGKSERVERLGKKGGAGVWDVGKEGCCWWRAQEGARVNQERGRKECAGWWKLPRRKGTETVARTWL